MGVSKHRCFFSPKSSILIRFSIINHPFWGIPIFGNTLIGLLKQTESLAIGESRQGRLERYLPDDVTSSDESLNFIETLGKRDGQRSDLWVVGILLVY